MTPTAPPWLAWTRDDPEREFYARLSPGERLRRFIDVCDVGRALLEGRPDRRRVLDRDEPMSEKTRATWLKLVAEARRAHPSWRTR